MANVYNDVGLVQEAENIIRKMPEIAEDICHRNPWHGLMCLVHVVSKEMLLWENKLQYL